MSNKLLIISLITFFLTIGCNNRNDKIKKATYCWILDEIEFFIDEGKVNGIKEINFNEMKQIFLEDKEHIKIVGINNNIEDLEFFIINVDLIFYYKNKKLILLENTSTMKCF